MVFLAHPVCIREGGEGSGDIANRNDSVVVTSGYDVSSAHPFDIKIHGLGPEFRVDLSIT